MAFPQTTTATEYNPSERAILGSLAADNPTSFDGHVFHDPVCLLGHKNGGPVDLDLTGAVFMGEVTLSLTVWRKLILTGTTFNAGLILSWVTADEVDLRNAVIHGVSDFHLLDAKVLHQPFAVFG